MNKIVKDAIIMTAITLISGCLLGLVYDITKQPIADAQEKAQQKAYQTVFEEAKSFDDYKEFKKTDAEQAVKDSGHPDNTIEGAVEAKDASGSVIGYVITVTSHAGYAGDITLSMGIKNDGTLNGYSITSISETAGLGMKAKEEKFYSQFNGKNAESYEVIKDKPAADNQIEAISGATISSKAVTYAVDAGLAYFQSIAEGGGSNE